LRLKLSPPLKLQRQKKVEVKAKVELKGKNCGSLKEPGGIPSSLSRGGIP